MSTSLWFADQSSGEKRQLLASQPTSKKRRRLGLHGAPLAAMGTESADGGRRALGSRTGDGLHSWFAVGNGQLNR